MGVEFMVWPFSKKQSSESMVGSAVKSPILTVRIDEVEVCTFFAHELPAEKRPAIELTRQNQELRFVDSKGGVRAYDLTSVFGEGDRHVYLSVRVSSGYAAQADAIVSKEPCEPEQAVKGNAWKGIRLEPFYLPECAGNPAELVGKGLFYRGLHFSGVITPGNASLLCICDCCKKSFRLQSFHAGFSNLCYFYCSRGSHTLVVNAFANDAPPVLGKADRESVARFERRLPACSQCGGEFRYLNPLRCPHCREPYIDFQKHPAIREQEYYGNYLYGAELQRWDGEGRI
jgi:hypothetical protein